MARQIYRFEIIEEVNRAQNNSVFRARDQAGDSTVTLCEWRVDKSALPNAEAKLNDHITELEQAEAFSSGDSLYIAAASEPDAALALGTLRGYGLFSGSWPGLLQQDPVAGPAPALEREPEVKIKDEVSVRESPQVVDRGLGTPKRLLLIAVLACAIIASLVYFFRSSERIDFEKVTVVRTLTGHSAAIQSLAFSPDGKLVASGSADQSLRVWGAATGEVRFTRDRLGDPVQAVAFSPDGKSIAAAAGFKIMIWDLSIGDLNRTLRRREPISLFAFAPDGKLLASGARDGIRLWDLSKSESPMDLGIGDHDIRALAMSPDGKFLASGGADSNILLWDLRAHTNQLIGEHSHVSSLSFSHDGKLLASASSGPDTTMYVWNLNPPSGRPRDSVRGATPVKYVAFDPKQDIVLGGGNIRLWNVDEAKTYSYSSEQGTVNTVAVSPTGKLFATGGEDSSVKLWRLR